MKILFLSHRVPYPPDKGDKIRSFNEIKYLSRKHELHLLAFCDTPDELAFSDQLRDFCHSVTLIPLRRIRQRLTAAKYMFERKPWTLGFYADPAMQEAAAKKIDSTSFDILFVYCSSMAPYVADIPSIPKVLDFVDSDGSKWRQYASFKPAISRWLYQYESKKLIEFETLMVHKFDRSIFVSPRETPHLQAQGKIQFIQNGIDLDYYAVGPHEPSIAKIIFVGAMNYFPNIDAVCFFARKILPRIRQKRDVQFIVVGSNPSRSVKRLSRIAGVTVTGRVHDVRKYLKDSRVAVVPMRIAQGIQNKILEALAAGLPVVATAAAAGGLKSLSGLPVCVADDPANFADRVLQFLDRPPSPDQLCSCRDHLKRYYSWETNLSSLDDLFDQLIPKPVFDGTNL